MKNVQGIIGRAFYAVADSLDRLWRGMHRALEQAVQRLVELWCDFLVLCQDIVFRLSLLAVNLGKVIACLSPGLIAIIVGATQGSWVWIVLGAVFVIGATVWAIRKAGPAESSGRRDSQWMMYFPPSWRSHATLSRLLWPLVREWGAVEQQTSATLALCRRGEVFHALVKGVRREGRRRMHSLRRKLGGPKQVARRRRAVSEVEATRQAFRQAHSVLEMVDDCLSPSEDHELVDDTPGHNDALDEVLERLREVASALKELSKR